MVHHAGLAILVCHTQNQMRVLSEPMSISFLPHMNLNILSAIQQTDIVCWTDRDIVSHHAVNLLGLLEQTETVNNNLFVISTETGILLCSASSCYVVQERAGYPFDGRQRSRIEHELPACLFHVLIDYGVWARLIPDPDLIHF